MQIAPIQIGRMVENPDVIIRKARSLGLEIADPDDLHVTLLWSRKPVNWDYPIFCPRRERIPVPTNRFKLRFFGDGSLLVLSFEDPVLAHRHKLLINAGASSDYPFKPHISIGKNDTSFADQEIILCEPLLLGPEYRKPAKL